MVHFMLCVFYDNYRITSSQFKTTLKKLCSKRCFWPSYNLSYSASSSLIKMYTNFWYYQLNCVPHKIHLLSPNPQCTVFGDIFKGGIKIRRRCQDAALVQWDCSPHEKRKRPQGCVCAEHRPREDEGTGAICRPRRHESVQVKLVSRLALDASLLEVWKN